MVNVPAPVPVACRVIVTRPQPQADAWVARLQAQGVPAVALPLMRIESSARFDAEVALAWQTLATQALVMFVSPNAVLAFFAARPAGQSWPAGTWAGATGPGTVAALVSQGVAPVQILAPPADAPTFDAEALWNHALAGRDWAGRSALIVRGEAGRDWLADTLRRAGANVAALAAYQRAAPEWDGASSALLREIAAEPARHVWLFSSSQCVGHLLAVESPGHSLGELLDVPVLATHPRIAETARQAGFSHVRPVSPDPGAIGTLLRGPVEPLDTPGGGPVDTMPSSGMNSLDPHCP